MTLHIYIFFVLLCGCGIGCAIAIYSSNKSRHRHKKEKKQRKKTKQPIMNIKEVFDSIIIRFKKALLKNNINKHHKRTGTQILEEKLQKNDESLIEFNCAADNIPVTEYVKEKRKREDSAYNILKRHE